MCRRCRLVPLPDRGRTCLDTGAYLLNYKGCAECGKMLRLEKRREEREEDEEDGEETVMFAHACSGCGHEVAMHHYSFVYESEAAQQLHTMECTLCGKAEDTQKIDVAAASAPAPAPQLQDAGQGRAVAREARPAAGPVALGVSAAVRRALPDAGADDGSGGDEWED